MVNFGYPYNDIVICKDSTDYLSPYIGLLMFANVTNVLLVLLNQYIVLLHHVICGMSTFLT